MPAYSEVYESPDGGLVVNSTSFDASQVVPAIVAVADQYGPAVASSLTALSSWQNSRAKKGVRKGSLVDRDRFLDPGSTMARIAVARDSLDDDVVGGAADLTESLALSSVQLALPGDPAVESVWNQWAGAVNLDGLLRDMWADLFSDSQTVVASWWERREFQVKGDGPAGLPRRKKFDLVVPTALSTMDSTRVVPVGTTMFGRDVLAYVASDREADTFDQLTGGKPAPSWRYRQRDVLPSLMPEDDIVRRLVRYRYQASEQVRDELKDAGLSDQDVSNLFVLDSRFVWRHTLTRSHRRFPRVRLASVFELLDIKSNMRAKDRSFLIGATNYLVVITQGDKDDPAKPDELKALQAGARNLAQFPVLIGDHRLEVKIVAPPMDATVDREKYDAIDARIAARVFGTFIGSGTEDSDPLKLGRVIGRGLESRRRMLRRSFEANVLEVIAKTNPELGRRPKLRFTPAQINLSFDANWATFLLDLRQANEVSRETTLSQFDLDQADEAAMRQREAEEFDDIFETFNPHGPNPNGTPGDDDPDPDVPTRLARRRGGRQQGGNRNGGGSAPGSGQGEETRDPRRSETGPRRRARTRAELLDELRYELDAMSRDDLIDTAGDLVDDRGRTAKVPYRHRMKADDLRDAIFAHQAALLPDDEPEPEDEVLEDD